MAGTVRVEANLLVISAECAFFNKCKTGKCLILKMKVKIMEYNIRNGPIRLQISTSIKVMRVHF